jgi:hypothetical protein
MKTSLYYTKPGPPIMATTNNMPRRLKRWSVESEIVTQRNGRQKRTYSMSASDAQEIYDIIRAQTETSTTIASELDIPPEQLRKLLVAHGHVIKQPQGRRPRSKPQPLPDKAAQIKARAELERRANG